MQHFLSALCKLVAIFAKHLPNQWVFEENSSITVVNQTVSRKYGEARYVSKHERKCERAKS